MTPVAQLTARWQQWWGTRSRRQQTLIARAGLAAGLIALAVFWWAIDGERARVRASVAAAEVRFQRMQQDVAEAQRLRGQIAPPALRGKALVDAVSASLQGRGLPLAVTAMGDDRVRLQGTASFDEFVTWLGANQQNYRSQLISLAAAREGALVKIDAVLGSP